MTQHILPEHTEEDRLIMRRLTTVIGGFVLVTVILALTVGLVLG